MSDTPAGPGRDDDDETVDPGPLPDVFGTRDDFGDFPSMGDDDERDHDDRDDEKPLDESADEAGARLVYEALLARIGENTPQPRLEATRRAVELLGDPHRSYPVIHITGTNGKTSTSRMIESILRAYGLRTGLMTSPHLVKVNERIVIDGEPISDAALAANWRDIAPFLSMVDDELTAAGEEPLTYFEALTVLAFASFADAPADVVVLEVGMGGEWDSTNVADGQVAVFTPIALDHTKRLGSTVLEIARTKSGIIKPSSNVVSAAQVPEALAELQRATELSESTFVSEGAGFQVLESKVAVGGQLISVQGIAGRYEEIPLPLFGRHQAQNAAVAIAAVESFLGNGTQPLDPEILTEGLAGSSSPGRLQVLSNDPTILVDAAHNPHGAHSLAEALGEYFDFDRVVAVLAILSDKDAGGIIRALAPVVEQFVITQSDSDRAIDADTLAQIAVGIVGPDRVTVETNVVSALSIARDLADETEKGGVVVTGSITLVGEVMSLTLEAGEK
ncbi:folylpolyglutamate synthase/dihydrofolate synthase family protein [Frondihabitans sp. VKM Ac-2883]|uniref:bifunctional folylpolyglutamate synthase/dihydrofolate synthase n=1 Tax=Frondihabitans sp. VKM Ac-2883 TaxID=2783823 RepID=UPI00188A06F7|nr:folylpolyglutamate synthase/dihydrofolate synthase family protein [Frondihabitans sp. VKM Ac-2883]MBF4576728.1 bifunctional folylpolyglutamate synthase/dihydrofolate synthase [Frondihabitans sp. VKM Ac-2883]